MTSMEGRDIYLRVTTKKGKSTVTHHRVWDADRFVESQRQLHSDPKKKEDDRCTVEVATKADYQKQ
jgi:hypothetical protein